MPPRTKILLAMSGGVDSSVAAALLLEQGHEVVGVFMRLGSPDEVQGMVAAPDDGACGVGRPPGRGCCSVGDAADARLVAAKLGIPFYVCNFRREFDRVIDYFVDEYNAGRTPNPCVRCNDWLKFGRLHEHARDIGATHVASGHYARVDRGPGGPRLRRGIDREKDQSYVLFGTPRARLAEMLLPVGDLEKSRVRALARDLDLPVFDKPDSQEICFVPDDDYAGLVRRRAPGAVAPGRIVDVEGRDLGAHAGHQHFTVGQRRGVGLALGRPVYVVEKQAATNTIVIGPRAALETHGCTAGDANWLVEPFERWRPCGAKIRYNAAPVAARVRATGEDTIEVCFEQPQHAVAPGQAVVCYDGDVVMCGGWMG